MIQPASIRNWLPLLLCGCLSSCSDDGASTVGMPTIQPGAVENPDGTFTNPDGSVVDPSTGMVVMPANPPGTGTNTPVGTPPTTPSSTTPGASTPTPSNPDAPQECSGSDVLASKRLVRLTFNQLVNSIGTLLGDALADELAVTYELPSALERTFPPLNNPREGSVIIDSQWQTGDAMAQAAGRHVHDNFATLSSCGDTASADCARQYAADFAAQAYRHPLTTEEADSINTVFDTVIAGGGTPAEAAQYSVYAALSAPQFLYRSEFGEGSLSAGLLSPYETASMLSYFITDGPPDAALLTAAASGALATPDQIGAQVDRLIATPEARENLQTAMFSYFGISTLNTIIIDPEVAPQFTEGLRASMMRETELFINSVLWNGSVADLLTSNTSYINQGLADLYGVPFPPAGATMDEDGFAQVTLPDNRSGVLTQPGFLTTRSSPEEPSVVRRGLLVNASLLCATNPPFPEAQAEEIEAVSESIADMSEREQAEFRAGNPECGGCHVLFDAYGLALDNFDIIGAYREVDHENRPIDPTVTLPPPAGGATVTSPAQMADELVASGAFTRCIGKNLLSYALAEGSTISSSSCATQAVIDRFTTTDQTFSSLIRSVAQSPTFTNRNAGGAQ